MDIGKIRINFFRMKHTLHFIPNINWDWEWKEVEFSWLCWVVNIYYGGVDNEINRCIEYD